MTLVHSIYNRKKEITVHEDDIQRICEDVISVIKKGLPEEAHTIDVFDYVLNECRQSLQHKTLNLE